MEYINAINEGFVLYDKIENEMYAIKRISDGNTDVDYSNGILRIAADWVTKDIEAKVEVSREEIVRKVLDEDLEPQEAIYRVIKEKICLSAHEFEK